MKTLHFTSGHKVAMGDANRPLKKSLLAAALPIGLAFAPHAAFAVDAANGVSSIVDVIIQQSASFQEISRVAFIMPANTTRHCVAVASAEAVNPLDGKVDHRYEFGLALNGNTPVNGSTRTIDIDDTNAADDEDRVEVSTTQFFTVSNANASDSINTIRFVARKNSVDPDLRVDDNSLSVMCFDNLL